jgi:hypothetical protein
MRRPLRALFCALAVPLLLSAMPAATSAATVGLLERFVEARAYYRDVVDCTQYELDISLQVGTWQRLHSNTAPDEYTSPQPLAQVWGFYQEWNWCENQMIAELSSWTELDEGQYAADKLNFAALYDVPITVYGEGGTSASFTVDLEWVGNGDVTPWVVISDVPVPSPHQPPHGPGISWVEHYNTASLSGTLTAPPYPFTLADNFVSEIGEVTDLISPARESLSSDPGTSS